MNGIALNSYDPQDNRALENASAAMVVRFGESWEILVPARIDLLTPYVLLEQERWFEWEMGFLSAWLKPGMRVIDVGANYGVYTISMASQVGSDGAVWAFEPCRKTFQMLTQSVAHNQFQNVAVVKAALGADFANVRLAVGENSELNQITDDASGPTESVDMTTLDHCDRTFGFGDVDFIKLDAEGYEVQVIGGAQRLLRENSPLIMFEFKHNDALNVDLLEKLESLGYSIYVLVPGINALVPYCESQHNDALLINLFACKHDRAQLLLRDGFLIDSHTTGETKLGVASVPPQGDCTDAVSNARLLHESRGIDKESAYARAVSLTLASENTQLAPALRLQAASAAFALCSQSSQASLWLQALKSRLSVFLGNRAGAAKIAAAILPSVGPCVNDPPPEVLAACTRYDRLIPASDRRAWFAASVHECFERSRAYSSYMLGAGCLANLQMIDSLGYLPADLERRRQLIHRNASHSSLPAVPDALLHCCADNLNYRFWRQQKLNDQSNQKLVHSRRAVANGELNS